MAEDRPVLGPILHAEAGEKLSGEGLAAALPPVARGGAQGEATEPHPGASWRAARKGEQRLGGGLLWWTTSPGALTNFQHRVVLIWWKWLQRRSQRAGMTWDIFSKNILQRYPLPEPVRVSSTTES